MFERTYIRGAWPAYWGFQSVLPARFYRYKFQFMAVFLGIIVSSTVNHYRTFHVPDVMEEIKDWEKSGKLEKELI